MSVESKIQRWDFFGGNHEESADMEREDEGEYVLYKDVHAQLDAKDALINQLQAEKMLSDAAGLALGEHIQRQDALIRAGDAVFEAREKLNKAKMGHGLFEARHNLDAALLAYLKENP